MYEVYFVGQTGFGRIIAKDGGIYEGELHQELIGSGNSNEQLLKITRNGIGKSYRLNKENGNK